MTERMAAWLAQRAADDELRVGMALMGVFIVIIWESIRLWPDRWRRVGRKLFLWMGGMGYALLLAVGVLSLVRDIALAR